MTKEELLKPRYKVIADYPGNGFRVGTILKDNGWGKWLKYGDKMINTSTADAFPHLFRKLEWWEERAKNNLDMPEYVKCIKSPDNIHVPGSIYKMQWNSTWGYDDETKEPIIVSTNCYEPSTEEEYLSYINKNKQ